MTKKFDKAKAETIQKCNKVLEAVQAALKAELGRCSFCHSYRDCGECPVGKLCGSGICREVHDRLIEVEEKIQQGLLSLEKVEEKSNV